MKKKKLLKKLYAYFDKLGVCVYTDDEFNFLWIHHGLSVVYIDKNRFHLSFEVNCNPMASANITQDVIAFATKNKMKVFIFEPYADVVNEEGIIQKTLFGDDAIKYYETGEVPIIEEVSPDKKDNDQQKKVDDILDQINTKGMKSLKKNQKEFLENFSKGKHQHNH